MVTTAMLGSIFFLARRAICTIATTGPLTRGCSPRRPAMIRNAVGRRHPSPSSTPAGVLPSDLAARSIANGALSPGPAARMRIWGMILWMCLSLHQHRMRKSAEYVTVCFVRARGNASTRTLLRAAPVGSDLGSECGIEIREPVSGSPNGRVCA
jgi:hypothetical protein